MSSGATILLVDDDPVVARAIEIAFRMAGHRVDVANGPAKAYSRLARRRYQAVLLDMNFTAGVASGEEGLACLKRLLADDPRLCVVVITAHSGIRIAVAAMAAGARDFVMKPWRNADLIAKVEAAIARAPAAPLAAIPASPLEGAAPVLLGESAAMGRLRDLLRRVAPTPAGVTVTGRSGSGRTLAARAIHAASGQAGAVLTRIDLRDADEWRLLDGAAGTVLLRHPDRLAAVAQDRLADRLPPAARVLAVADGVDPLTPALRRRIATVELAVPPLADREDDPVLLARHFAAAAAERFGRDAATLTASAEAAVRARPWPDEVRGLALAIERAVLLADGGAIDAAALGLLAPTAPPSAPDMTFDLTQAERATIAAALREHRHNVSHAAAALGLSRGALYRRMARHGL